MIEDKDALLTWYDVNKRALPWRQSNPDPYHVLLSELMLQQTTVETVKPRFAAFLERFPTIRDLANADIEEVLHAWQGLGYYRRARSLHAAAQTVMSEYGGVMPGKAHQLIHLPGVGRYTAAAIAAIAFRESVVPVDGNIARIVSRQRCLADVWPKDFDAFQAAADHFACSERPGDVAQALMDLGSSICRPRRPSCLLCPIQSSCEGFRQGFAEDYPKKTPKKAKRLMFAAAFLVMDNKRQVQFRQRPEKGLLAGMIELPATPWQDIPFEGLAQMLELAPNGIEEGRLVDEKVRHIFTHIDLEIALVRVSKGQAIDSFWHGLNALDELALPTLTKKLLAALPKH